METDLSRQETRERDSGAGHPGGNGLHAAGETQSEEASQGLAPAEVGLQDSGEGVRARGLLLAAPPYRNSAVAKLLSLTNDLGRYNRFLKGHSLEEIASADGIPEDAVERSIVRGEHQEAVRKQNELMFLRHKASVANEKIRIKANRKMQRPYLDGLKTLLKGEQHFVERNEQGQLQTIVIKDNDAISQGLKHFRDTTGLEQKKELAAPATVVNVSQQAAAIANAGAGTPGSYSFEDVLSRIKRGQSQTFIDAEVVPKENE